MHYLALFCRSWPSQSPAGRVAQVMAGSWIRDRVQGVWQRPRGRPASAP